MGFSLFLSSIFYTIHKLIFVEQEGFLTEYQLIMSIMLALFGLLLLCVALQSEYIGKIYLSSNKHPQYIVREQYSLDNKAVSDNNVE